MVVGEAAARASRRAAARRGHVSLGRGLYRCILKYVKPCDLAVRHTCCYANERMEDLNMPTTVELRQSDGRKSPAPGSLGGFTFSIVLLFLTAVLVIALYIFGGAESPKQWQDAGIIP